jgi:hypothetical protein
MPLLANAATRYSGTQSIQTFIKRFFLYFVGQYKETGSNFNLRGKEQYSASILRM